MTSTFYIQQDKEDVFREFVKKCNKENKSYSSKIIELIERDTKDLYTKVGFVDWLIEEGGLDGDIQSLYEEYQNIKNT